LPVSQSRKGVCDRLFVGKSSNGISETAEMTHFQIADLQGDFGTSVRTGGARQDTGQALGGDEAAALGNAR
jgi:hypothetical protein